MLRLATSSPFFHFHFHFHSLFLHRTSARLPASAHSNSVDLDFHGIAVEKKSKGQKKREAHRAVDWAIQLSNLSNAQLIRTIRWGGLQEEVFDAITLLKKIGRDGKNARRRQLNLIGGMLRSVNPDLMEEIIKATKDGDASGLFIRPVEKVEHAGFSEEAKEKDIVKDTAERWLQGLLLGDSEVSTEVYSIRYADFDRQELRRLVIDALQTEHAYSEREKVVDPESMDLLFASANQKRSKLYQFLEGHAEKASEIDT